MALHFVINFVQFSFEEYFHFVKFAPTQICPTPLNNSNSSLEK